MEPGRNASEIRVVIVDDDADHADLARVAIGAALRGAYERIHFDVHNNAPNALAMLPSEGPCVIFCDYRLASQTALDWLPAFTREDAGPVIVMTSAGHEDIAANVFRGGATDYVNKSVVYEDRERLGHIIAESLRRYELEKTTRELTRQLKIANQDLHLKSERLAELSDTAHRFVEDVAHEFRTPLAVIQEFASIMADGIGGEVSPKQGEFLGFIANATRDLTLLVDDFLDSGKLRAGTLRVDRRSHRVDDVLDSCWTVLEARAQARGITIERVCQAQTPRVYVDLDKAKRTITNLAINAIKFSAPGARVVIHAEADGEDLVRFCVSDQGPGMSAEQREMVFDRFRSGAEVHTGDTKGFGLGLSIVKELTSINLGSVSVCGAEGGGSRFSFTAPVDRLESVVRCYLGWIATLGEATTLSMLRVRERSPDGTPEALEACLSSMSRATDLKLPSPDGDGVVLVGVGYKPEEWKARILAWHAEAALPGAGSGPGRLLIDVLGTHDVQDAEVFLLEHVTPSVEV